MTERLAVRHMGDRRRVGWIVSRGGGCVAVGSTGGVLVERGKDGGDCLNYGCVPSEVGIAAARAQWRSARRGASHHHGEPRSTYRAVRESARRDPAIAPNGFGRALHRLRRARHRGSRRLTGRARSRGSTTIRGRRGPFSSSRPASQPPCRRSPASIAFAIDQTKPCCVDLEQAHGHRSCDRPAGDRLRGLAQAHSRWATRVDLARTRNDDAQRTIPSWSNTCDAGCAPRCRKILGA